MHWGHEFFDRDQVNRMMTQILHNLLDRMLNDVTQMAVTVTTQLCVMHPLVLLPPV